MQYAEGGSLAAILERTWWVLLLRAFVAIPFGLLAWLYHGISLASLVLLFGAFALADGILGVWSAFAGLKTHEDWWVLLLWGLVGIGIGDLTFFAPDINAVALVFYIAIWVIATGILEIVAAIRLRKDIEGEWLLALAGIVSVAFGILLVLQPRADALALLWLIATYAVIFGILLLILAFKARSFTRKVART
jgi:uncharacterized membrane protein HdeD (DUF308 family)